MPFNKNKIKYRLKFSFLLLLICCFAACSEDDLSDELEPEPTACELKLNSLKMNQIQILGSHNSYRLRTYQPIFDFVLQLVGILPESLNPEAWDYTHLPLSEQLDDYGMRSFELDIYHDPQGGRFYERKGLAIINESTDSGIDELLEPGMKVMHIVDVDYETNYYTLKSALTTLKNWSDQHPQHIPIFLLIETKEDDVKEVLSNGDFNEALPFTPAAFDSLDREIKDVFGENLEKVITPDKLRGEYSSVNEAVLAGAWPTLDEARGKFVFLLDGPKEPYLEGHAGLEGRILFVYSSAGNAETAFMINNQPLGNEEFISEKVAEGYMIRTRADSDTKEARTGDVTRRDVAFASGAQIISTDYYRPDPRADTSSQWTNYTATFPNGELARFNPINVPLDSTMMDCLILE